MSRSLNFKIDRQSGKPAVKFIKDILEDQSQKYAHNWDNSPIPPPESRCLSHEFVDFVQLWVEKNLTPLPADTDLSIETWLNGTHYPAWRKKQLIEKFNKVKDILEKDEYGNYKYAAVKSFIKDEFYPEQKHSRIINSRTDEFKCAVGPTFKKIEEAVYKLKFFIKNIPHKDRAKFLMKNVYSEGSAYMESDFAQYESHFTDETMGKIEFVLYDYMTQNLPNHEIFMFMMERIVASVNLCEFKNIVLQVRAKRMSGEMNTSLGNGFANLMLIMFVLTKMGYSAEEIRVIIEGDDALTAIDPDNIPQSCHFAALGFTIKLIIHTDFNLASFCGLVFHPLEMINITNPIEAMLSLGWLPAKYRLSTDKLKKSLLKDKVLSMLYEYNGCPIIFKLVERLLFLMKDIIPKSYYTGYYEAQLHEERKKFKITPRSPGPLTRLTMEQKYGVTIDEQLALEDEISQMGLEPFHSELLLSKANQDQIDYFENYVITTPVLPKDDFLKRPTLLRSAGPETIKTYLL